MKRNEILLLDGNHLAYRAYYKFANLRTIDGVKTSIIYGIPYICESLIRRFNPIGVALVFDGGHSKFRKTLLPDYKKRDKKLGWDGTDFYRQKDEAGRLMMSLGISVIQRKGYEADDLITLAAQNFSKNHKVVIISGDKDFNQLISKNISVYNVQKGIIYRKDNLKDYVGYSPKQCLDYLSLCGDKSDNIPGYPGIGPKRAMQILDKYGSVRKYLKSADQFGKIDNKKLTELMLLNRKLIGLIYFYRKFLKGTTLPYLSGGLSMNEEALRKQCKIYEINSFMKPQFLKTYRDIHK